MANPYENLPGKAFWRTAVASKSALEISDLWDPKFEIGPEHKIATMGSCFAQHIGRALKKRSFTWFDAEPAPASLSPDQAKALNYGIFSARTGNIYTASALRQWVSWCLRQESPPDEVWYRNNRCFDPFRPAVQPDGFASIEELLASREITLDSFRTLVSEADIFVFTLGLTEAWVSKSRGYTYAVCPGTVAGEFDRQEHVFKNYQFGEALADLERVIDAVRSVNAKIRFLLTVSPVPLTATASTRHVLPATVYSKSVLRAVAGQVAESHDFVDYFPSYEMITGTPFRSKFYEQNLRSVSSDGVEFVMDSFFRALETRFGIAGAVAGNGGTLQRRDTDVGVRNGADQVPPAEGDDEEDLVCEEQLLEAFAPTGDKVAPSHTAQRRVCFIGDSHLAALKLAYDRKALQNCNMDCAFWGFARSAFTKIGYEDGKLRAPSAARAERSGLANEINLTDFDAVVLVGGWFTVARTLDSLRAGADDLRKQPKSLLAKGLRRRANRTLVGSLIRSIPGDFRGPVLLVPTPARSEELKEDPDLVINEAELEHLNKLLTMVMKRRGIAYVPQPMKTVTAGKWTKKEYTLAFANVSLRGEAEQGGLARGHYTHMNADYGAEVLAAVQVRLEEEMKPKPRRTPAFLVPRWRGFIRRLLRF